MCISIWPPGVHGALTHVWYPEGSIGTGVTGSCVELEDSTVIKGQS